MLPFDQTFTSIRSVLCIVQEGTHGSWLKSSVDLKVHNGVIASRRDLHQTAGDSTTVIAPLLFLPLSLNPGRREHFDHMCVDQYCKIWFSLWSFCANCTTIMPVTDAAQPQNSESVQNESERHDKAGSAGILESYVCVYEFRILFRVFGEASEVPSTAACSD